MEMVRLQRRLSRNYQTYVMGRDQQEEIWSRRSGQSEWLQAHHKPTSGDEMPITINSAEQLQKISKPGGRNPSLDVSDVAGLRLRNIHIRGGGKWKCVGDITFPVWNE